MSSGFVSEQELSEAKQKRQEEWEKVRQPDQPLELPEEPYESRSLYERLKEQKDKKDYEFEEAHKLKNLIRGLDDDEVDFLDVIDKAKLDAERKQQIEENNELNDFRKKVANLQEKNLDHKIQAEVAKVKVTKTLASKPTQKSILSGLVRKRKVSDTQTDDPANKKAQNSPKDNNKVQIDEIKPGKSAENHNSDIKTPNVGAMECIGILPGIGKYTESSDSDKSTDTDEDYDYSAYDWIGRKIKRSKCE